jgi:uncharacterized membrane protein
VLGGVLLAGTALAGPLDGEVSHAGPGVGDPALKAAHDGQQRAGKAAKGVEDNARGLGGGVVIGPVPSPTPGIHPEDYVNAAIQTVASGLDDAAQGLGGVHIGPIPSPTPGLRPESYANKAIQTVASGLDDAAQGLGGVHIGPIPSPTPGLRPIAGVHALPTP